MPGLFFNNPATPEGKYLIQRRDGTVPDWPSFVLAASDPAAPYALRAYAGMAEALDYDPAYVTDVRNLADQYEEWRQANGNGDPDAPPHRTDDPEIIAKMRKGRSA